MKKYIVQLNPNYKTPITPLWLTSKIIFISWNIQLWTCKLKFLNIQMPKRMKVVAVVRP
jgi:hypothetical protein